MDLEDWTEDEKKYLLMALKKYGDSDIEAIQSKLPQKSINDIRDALYYYKKKAESKWLNREIKVPDEVGKWIDIIDKLIGKNQGHIQDIIPRVLKYIAMYEKKCVASDINLSEAYDFLSAACYAKPTKELSERTTYFLYQCLVRLAESLQRENIEESETCLEELVDFKKLVENLDETMINPLSIPEHLLKLNSSDENDILQ